MTREQEEAQEGAGARKSPTGLGNRNQQVRATGQGGKSGDSQKQWRSSKGVRKTKSREEIPFMGSHSTRKCGLPGRAAPVPLVSVSLGST